jgi:hypothetical protein
MDDLLFKYVDTSGVQAFEKFTSENVRASKDLRKPNDDLDFKFDDGESEASENPSHSLPTGGSLHKPRRKRAGPNIHPDAARTLHDLVFTRLKHSSSFHKEGEEVK